MAEPVVLAQLTSLATSLLASQIDKRLVNPVENFIEKALSKGGNLLPANHHIERGTYRAAILACRFCVSQIKPSRQLMHPSEGIEDYTKYGARDQLQMRLGALAKTMQPAGAGGIQAWLSKSKREAALADCARLFPEDVSLSITADLDAVGGRTLAMQNARNIEGAVATPREFTDLRMVWMPGLPEHLAGILAEWGGWPASRQTEIANVLVSGLFGPDELWLNSFAFFYIEEIRQDPELRATATLLRAENANEALERITEGNAALRKDVKALASDLEASFVNIKSDLESVQESLQDIRDRLLKIQSSSRLDKRQIFFPVKGSSAENEFKPFHFSEEEEEFVGRDAVINWLKEEVLETDETFSWSVISGPAGMGKSRLAFHVMNEFRSHYRYAGFVKRDVISDPRDAVPSSADIDGPTLLILDYAGSAPEDCANFLAHFADLACVAEYPVRALVLVRRSDDDFFEEVRSGKEYGRLRQTRVKSNSPEAQDGEVVLAPLSQEDILSLMRSRMARTAMEQRKERGGAHVPVLNLKEAMLLKALKEYGADEGRPLYALLIADGLQRGMPPERGQGETVEQARLRLLWAYIKGQFEQRWEPASRRGNLSKYEAEELLDRHVSFAVLSTFCRGLTDDAWLELLEDKELGANAHDLLPFHRRIRRGAGPETKMNYRLLASVVGALHGRKDEIFPAVEPDLIGEAMLLGVFDDAGDDWTKSRDTAIDRREFLVDLSWKADPDGTAYFINLVAQDFPKTADACGWFLPEITQRDHEYPRARLLRNLASLTLGVLRNRAANREDVRRMDRLVRLFDFSKTSSKAAFAQYATALAAIAQELSFIINKSQAPSSRLQVDPLSDPQKSDRRQRFKQASGQTFPSTFAPVAEKTVRQTPQQILSRRSAPKTVRHAMRLLRRIAFIVQKHMDANLDFDVRADLFDAAQSVLTSVYWDARESSRLGFAHSGLSKRERAQRDQGLAILEKLLKENTDDEENVALVGKITSGAILAENGKVSDRGQEVFNSISALASAEKFQHAGAISRALSFLPNYYSTQRDFPEYDPNAPTHPHQDILEVSEHLFARLFDTNEIAQKDRDVAAASFASISWQYHDWWTTQANEVAKPGSHVGRLVDFWEQHGSDGLEGNAVNLVSLLFEATADDELLKPLELQRLVEYVDTAGFDSRALNDPSWTKLTACLRNFMQSNSEVWPKAIAVIKRLLADVGTRAFENLQTMLDGYDWQLELASDRCTDLVQLLENEVLEQAELRLSVLGKALLKGDYAHLFDEIDRWWKSGISEDALTARTFALQIVMLAIPWRGGRHPDLAKYRRFVLESFQGSDGLNAQDVSADVIQRYKVALTDAAGMFAQMDIADGLSPDEWINAVRTE